MTTNETILKPETFLIYHIWYDADGVANDLTGWTGELHIYDKQEVLLETVSLTTSEDGEIEGSADSSSWPVGIYSYYMRLNDGAGRIVDLLTGKVCVE
jgi:hypothetical protein